MTQAKLRITLLGGLTISRGGTAVTGFASRKVEALLIYLAGNPRTHPRETLATLLWPENDQNRALANLSVALNSLRKQLDPYILADRHTIAFNVETDYELDTAVFQQAIQSAQAQQQVRGKLSRIGAAQLQTAVSQYQGDFLAGFHIRGTPEFEAWALLEQERLRQMFLTALADLITFHQQRGQLATAIDHAQRLLAVDPLQENIQRQLMMLYAQDNQRPAALAQYEQCVRILDEELGVEPDEETTVLYEQIAAGQSGQVVEGSVSVPSQPTAARHNISAATNAFVGREAELATIERWLTEPNGRLLTIVGPGGMGKTRLAQEAARTQLGKFADGVWLVSLVAFQDLDEAATAVANALGFTLSGKAPLLVQLLDQLRPLEALLVLDNLEHLLGDDLRDFLSQLIQDAPDLRLITTSRERLRLQAERVLDLAGLLYPVNGNRLTVNGLPITDYPAAQLFIDRAQRVQANFDGVGQTTAVTQLCQLVGGLPLALELAATWTRVLSVEDIVVEIRRGLDALTTILHDVPARHRSLRAVIESSWQQLPAAEQTLFRKTAVFRGGFTRAAAEAVAGVSLSQLLLLVDRSFLRLDEDRRFRRHPLLLRFAGERLASRPEEQTQTQAAHARFFADLVAEQAKHLPGADALAALSLLAADLENIRAAWQWALSAQAAPLLQQMVTGVGRFFADRSRYLEGAAFFAHSLEMIGQWPVTAVRDQLLAQIQIELGIFWHENGRFAESETVLRQAEAVAQQHNLADSYLRALHSLSVVAADQGEPEAASQYLEEAWQLCPQNGNPEQRMLLLWQRGSLLTDRGEYGQALTAYRQAMNLAQILGNGLVIARLNNGIAIIANRQRNYQEAIHYWQLARAGFKDWDHHWGLAATSHNLAMAYCGLEQYDMALEMVNAAIVAHEKIGHKRGVAGGLAVRATIYVEQGKRPQARRHYYESLQLSQAVGVTWLAVITLISVAELDMSYGELRRAALLLTFAAQHPSTSAFSLDNAQKLLNELRAELPPVVMAEAEKAARSHTLDSLIAWLINEVSGSKK
jgi:DNA-binding SARP family transcriptional activator/predicted ATPase/Tfp pilus assembly protein PilF